MKEIVGVITNRISIGDELIKDVLAITAGSNPIRLGASGCEFSVDKLPSDQDLETVRNFKVDINFVNKGNREKQIIVADMDGTLINEESLDELAKLSGHAKEIKDLTIEAMNGSLPFNVSIRKRVKLLTGIPYKFLEECFENRISLSDGATALIRTMNARNALTMIVSGGLKYFVSRVAKILNVSTFVSNDIVSQNGILTGELVTPIIDEFAKFDVIRSIINKCGMRFENLMAVGDGANDVRMLQTSGLGVAYRGKEVVKSSTNIHLDHSDLRALLFLQGISEGHFK